MSLPLPLAVPLWSLLATVAITAVLAGSQGGGLTRLSLPFLLGTFFTGHRHRALLYGVLLYLLGGQLFGVLYFLGLAALGRANLWLGMALGCLHALFLLTVILPVLPHLHPRVASEYDGPRGPRRLEPPGFLALNYGYRTPLVTIIGHVLYGAVLGAGFATLLEHA